MENVGEESGLGRKRKKGEEKDEEGANRITES